MSARAADEMELKAVVDDMSAAESALRAAGATLAFRGRLEDRRYDSRSRIMAVVDHVLRLRIYRDDSGARGYIDWKGPTRREDGYKVREEISSGVEDPVALAQVLDRLGYVVTREIDRDITQYVLDGAIVRFERYPRMDTLVEVEGSADSIERAIRVMGMDRSLFSTDRLLDYVTRYEQRTGERAAVSEAELHGDYRFAREDA